MQIWFHEVVYCFRLFLSGLNQWLLLPEAELNTKMKPNGRFLMAGLLWFYVQFDSRYQEESITSNTRYLVLGQMVGLWLMCLTLSWPKSNEDHKRRAKTTPLFKPYIFWLQMFILSGLSKSRFYRRFYQNIWRTTSSPLFQQDFSWTPTSALSPKTFLAIKTIRVEGEDFAWE